MATLFALIMVVMIIILMMVMMMIIFIGGNSVRRHADMQFHTKQVFKKIF